MRLRWRGAAGVAALLALALPAGPAATAAPPDATRLGVFQTLPGPQRIAGAQALGVDWVRPAAVRVGGDLPDPGVQAVQQAGLHVVLTVVNRTGPQEISGPPADLAAYQTQLARVIDTYRPALVSIENEEQAAKFYAGTPQQYLAQLAAAVQVAHRAGQPITNGGIVDVGITLATWGDLWKRGKHAAADLYARRAFPHGRPGLRHALGDVPDTAHPHRKVLAHNPRLAVSLANARALIAGFRRIPMDYVNFHWYETGSDVRPLAASVRYLEHATGKVAVTNEMGQLDLAASTTSAVLNEGEALKLPYLIWFGSDGTGAQGLTQPDGTLRASGAAFRAFALAHPSPS